LPKQPHYFSVDIEAAGPNPAGYALLSLGACTVCLPEQVFYAELQPTTLHITPEALEVHGLDPRALAETGLPPGEVLEAFERWVLEQTPEGHLPVFVALNAAFDWMFVCDYFYRYLGRNPFGHSALDIKAYYMGQQGVGWFETGYNQVSKALQLDRPLAHNALQDARDQAEIFRRLLEGRPNGV
jgi:DNA polymerase III epsilon subunit-like protein